MTITNTLENAKRLEAAELTPAQSQAISEIVEDAVSAGLEDLKSFITSELAGVEARLEAKFEAKIESVRTDLKSDIQKLRTDLKSDIQELRTELKGDIQDLRIELKGDVQELRTELKGDIQELRTDLTGEIHGVSGEIKDVRVEFHLAQRDQLLKYVLIMTAIVSVAVAIIKLFPNAN